MKTRIEKLINLISGKVDCALITDDINRRYLTGMKSSAGLVFIFPEKAYFIIDFRYIEKARKTVKCCEVIEQEQDIFGQLKNILQKHCAKTIAVESQSMTLQRLKNFQKNLKNFEFITSNLLSQALYDLRTMKSPEEIEKIKSAQELAEQALNSLLENLHVGMTEREVALALDFHMRKNGAEDLSFETIALTGSHTSMPHGVPDDRKIQKNDFVLMDFGAVVDGYHSDMTRTVCVGQPTEEMQEIYEIVRHAQDMAKEFAKAGVSGKDLDAVARNIINKAGYDKQFGHSLGHGVGMEIHEFPVASPTSNKILEVGNVVTIEPGIYLPEKFGVRIEDFVHITKNGCENLTNITNTLICL
ncbi:MAG: aminopeptidase P family protein [Oscillospiraceae bacterium]|nr:aminopeptidase P family protein [Oscillospiraceae bacterium]